MKTRKLLDALCVRYQAVLPHDFILFLIYNVQDRISKTSMLEGRDCADNIAELLYDVMLSEDYGDINAERVAKMIEDETKKERPNVRQLLGHISKHAHNPTTAFKLFIFNLHNRLDEKLTIPLVFEKKFTSMILKQRSFEQFPEEKLRAFTSIIEDIAKTPS